jgi:hypothetical protein
VRHYFQIPATPLHTHAHTHKHTQEKERAKTVYIENWRKKRKEVMKKKITEKEIRFTRHVCVCVCVCEYVCVWYVCE